MAQVAVYTKTPVFMCVMLGDVLLGDAAFSLHGGSTETSEKVGEVLGNR